MFTASNTIRILISFCIGLVLAKFLALSIIGLLFFLLSLIAIVVIFLYSNSLRLKSSVFSISLFLSLTVLGALSIETNEILSNDFKSYSGTNRTVEVKIKELFKTDKKFSRAIVDVKNVYGTNSKKSVDGKMLLYIENDTLNDVKINDSYLIRAQLKKVENYNNPGEFDAEWYWSNKDVDFLAFVKKKDKILLERKSNIFSLADNIRSILISQFSKVLSGDELAVAVALVLGDKGLLTTEVRTVFSAAGAMHVLAVSGLHVGILLMILSFVFKRIKLFKNNNAYLYLAIVFLWIYALITGFSPSVIRATLMFSFMAYGKIKGYNFFGLDIICFSAFLMLLFNPYYLFDIGFQLSYCAMISIAMFFRPIKDVLKLKNKVLNWVWDGVAICFAAQIGTVPITLYYFHQFPNYFLITNVGLLVLAVLCMSSGVGFLSFGYGVLQVVFGKVLFVVFYVLIGFVSWVDSLPGALAKGFQVSLFQLFFLLTGLLVLYFGVNSRKLKVQYLGLIVVFIGFSTVSVQRFQNLRANSIRVLNHNSPLIIVKYGSVNYCFYDLLDRTNVDGTKFLAESYSKFTGGKCVYYSLKEKDVILPEIDFSIVKDKKYLGYTINFEMGTWFLPVKRDAKKPGLKNLLSRVDNFALKEENDIDLFENYFIIPF